MGRKEAWAEYLEKLHKKEKNKTRETKKRQRPEKDVEREVLKWANLAGVTLTVIDSGFQSYNQKKVSRIGFCDLSGYANTNDGNIIPVFIELKAKYQKLNVSPAQYDFISEKINHGCFACVTDSATRLETLWRKFNYLKSKEERILYLLSELKRPKKAFDFDGPLFES